MTWRYSYYKWHVVQFADVEICNYMVSVKKNRTDIQPSPGERRNCIVPEVQVEFLIFLCSIWVLYNFKNVYFLSVSVVTKEKPVKNTPEFHNFNTYRYLETSPIFEMSLVTTIDFIPLPLWVSRYIYWNKPVVLLTQ